MNPFHHEGAETRRRNDTVISLYSRKQKSGNPAGGFFRRHPDESRGLVADSLYWIPAFAGMTKKKILDVPGKCEDHFTSPRLRVSVVKFFICTGKKI